MSDAWATARLAQRVVLLAQKREDQKLMARLREQAMSSKQIKKLSEVILELHPRKESKELSDVSATEFSLARPIVQLVA
ncbi:Uncharacterized protein SCF082_LOCUS17675 [Durusdinium trenchii]|uniref:Uncharacterized protein n=1 Tax=Durusdinium trenchii TaxID=1381693 RepID=A0ABP0KK09_9DINO